MQCGPRYLPLCSIPVRMSRDGYAGPNAHIYMPFCGYVFFDGATFTPNDSEVPQPTQKWIGGVSSPGVGPVGFCG